MEGSFSQYLEPWRDYYTLAGTAAATFMGLLFVSVSLNPRIMADDGPQGLRAWAGQTMSNLIALLILSLFCMMPDLDHWAFGTSLLILGGQGIVRAGLRLRTILRDRKTDPDWDLPTVLWRGVVPMIAYVVAIFVAFDVYAGSAGSLDLLVIVAFMLVSSGAGAAWQLLIVLGNRDAVAPKDPPAA